MENEESDIKTHESGIKYRIYQDENNKDLRVFASDSSKRLEFEEYEEYRFRRQINKYLAKQYKRGFQFWPSYVQLQDGRILPNTYVKEKAERVKQEISKRKENEQD